MGKQTLNDYKQLLSQYKHFLFLIAVAAFVIIVEFLDLEPLNNFVEFLNFILAIFTLLFLILLPFKWVRLSRTYNRLMKEEHEDVSK